MCLMKDTEMIEDVVEAIEKMNKWKFLYEVVLKQTGSKEQAAKTVKWIDIIAEELDIYISQQ